MEDATRVKYQSRDVFIDIRYATYDLINLSIASLPYLDVFQQP